MGVYGRTRDGASVEVSVRDRTGYHAWEAVCLLFVYGSLRRGCDNDEACALRAGAEWVGPGWTHGALSEIDGYPALTPDGSGLRVTGDIFRMRDPAAMLAFLDVYEGCAPGSPAPHDYRRSVMEVSTQAGKRRAWVYVTGEAG